MELIGFFFILGVFIALAVTFYNWWNTSDNQRVRSITKRSADKCIILYHQDDRDSYKMRYAAYFAITILVTAGLFLMQKEKYTYNSQLLPALNAGLFAFIVTAISSIFGLYIFAQLIISAEGIWLRTSNDIQEFRLIEWGNIDRIDIYDKLDDATFNMEGRIISNTPSEMRKSTYIVLFLKTTERIIVIGHIRNSVVVTQKRLLAFAPSRINIQVIMNP